MQRVLESAGKPLEGCRTVLDFGCGCGRTLVWIEKLAPGADYCGVDVDPASVEWCRSHLRFGVFAANRPLPPLAFPDRYFDLVYAISVFTHLDDRFLQSWTDELRRVAARDGAVVVSFHGSAARSGLTAAQRSELERAGFLHCRSRKLAGIFPDWYHTTYHDPDYIKATLARRFERVVYFREGMGEQDVAVGLNWRAAAP